MKLCCASIGICLFLVSACGEVEATEKSSNLPVWPREAGAIPQISLSDLIVEALPTDAVLGWDHLQINEVLWVTEGIDYDGGIPSRVGYARIRASDVETKLLRQRWEELAWTIQMSTEGNSKWGPTIINIGPGVDSKESQGKYACFGEGFAGCSFGVEALRGPKIELTTKCSIGSGVNMSVVMDAVTRDGRRGTVVHRGSGGSGGVSNSVEISTLSFSEYCEVFKNRGY